MKLAVSKRIKEDPKSHFAKPLLAFYNEIFEYEQQRAVLLYKVCASRFMGIAPEQVQVIFDYGNGFAVAPDDDLPDFRRLFSQLSGEAAMWRDYLILQQNDAVFGKWHYAQFDKCANCRFYGICPAQTGTAEPTESSI